MQKTICSLGLCLWGAVFFPSVLWAEPITVFAASSLRDGLSEVAQAYEEDTGTPVVLVFAATSQVARQVARGAPADVVLLADEDWADWLVAQSVIDASVPFAGNRLVVVGAADRQSINDINGLVAMLGEGKLAMAQVDAVPAGRYGRAALETHGLWDGLAPSVVQAANVRAALRFVERGEATFGIGYSSDLVALPSLRAVYAFAPDSHGPIVYSGASLGPAGSEFMDYIQSDTAQAVLADWGFLPPPVSP